MSIALAVIRSYPRRHCAGVWFLLACAAPDLPASDPDGSTDPRASLPDGDSLARLGEWQVEGGDFAETTGLVALDATRVAACFDAEPPQVFDVSDPAAPTPVAPLNIPEPARERCQNLAATGDGRLLVANHGDERGDPWLALLDVTDPTAPRTLSVWADNAAERVAASGDTAWLAGHDAGLLRFDLSADTLADPVLVPGVTGNVYTVAERGGRLAVGTLEGDLFVVDGDDVRGPVALSGPVRDVAWLDDGVLVAACGSDGIDRVEVADLRVSTHVNTWGPALDLAVLDDAVAVAAWSDVLVVDPATLTVLAEEDPTGGAGTALAFAAERVGGTLVVGEWAGIPTYAWDGGVSAPEVRLPDRSVDLGTVAAGEEVARTVVIRNDGPKPLSVSVDADPALHVDRAELTIPAGEGDYFEARWTSDGEELAAALTLTTDDPDEPVVTVAVQANGGGAGPGDLVPDFRYAALDSSEVYASRSLSQPALLSYFATF